MLNPKTKMEIIKNGFTLREWRTEDAKSLAESANNIKIWRNLRDYFPHPYTEQDALKFIKTAPNCEPIDLAIVVDGCAVGGVNIVRGGDVARLNGEIGYWLGEKYWSRGIMTEVTKAVTDYVFEHTDIIRIFAPIYGYNSASMHVLEKSGFVKAGVMRSAAIKEGALVDVHYYERLK